MVVKKMSKKLIKKCKKYNISTRSKSIKKLTGECNRWIKLAKQCKKLKISLKVGKKKKSFKRLTKECKQFIQRAKKLFKKKGTIGAFKRWCKSKGLLTNGKVKKKCITKGKKSSSKVIRKRAIFAQNVARFGNTRIYNAYRDSDWNWDALVDQGLINKKQIKKIQKNCEDGESSILGDRLVPGLYVDIGNMKCLSVQDIVGMKTTNRFVRNTAGILINPFTRVPLTRRIISKIKKLLALAGEDTDIENVYQEPEPPPNPDVHELNIMEYEEELLGLLREGHLTMEEAKTVVREYGINSYETNVTDFYNDQPDRWRYANGQIDFLLPLGDDDEEIWIHSYNLGQLEFEIMVNIVYQ